MQSQNNSLPPFIYFAFDQHLSKTEIEQKISQCITITYNQYKYYIRE